MKKILAILLAVMMIAALAVPAFADGEPAAVSPDESAVITIQAPAEQASQAITFTPYQILKAAKVADSAADANPLGNAGGQSGITYYVETDALKNALGTWFTFSEAKVRVGSADVWAVTGTTAEFDATSQTVISAILTAATGAGVSAGTAFRNDNGTANSGALDVGYYIITSNLGSSVVALTNNMTIEQKNQYPTIAKAVAADDAVVEIGEAADFTITVVIPATATGTTAVIDEMDEHFEYVEGSLKINDEAPAADITWSAATKTLGEGAEATTVNVKTATLATLPAAAGTYTITYSATMLNTAARDTDYVNYAHLNYADGVYVSVDVTAAAQTKAFDFIKYDKTAGEKEYSEIGENGGLAGAEFKLQRKDGENWADVAVVAVTGGYRLATGEEQGVTITSTTGSINILGIDENADKYQLVETKAPTGYNGLDAGVGVKADDTVAIGNATGTVLPSTGGIGTTIFYVVGGILVVAAGVVLITKKRLSKEED